MKREQNIQKLIMLALSEAGCLVWRNNVGSYTTVDGAFIRYGVGGVGGSDLIGIYKPTGQFLAIEVKSILLSKLSNLGMKRANNKGSMYE